MGLDVEVPDFQSLMLPLLELADVKEWHVGAAVDELAERLGLTDEQRVQSIPSGQSRFSNRAQWAKSYLGKAGLTENTKRGYFRISELGREVLKKQPTRIDIKFLQQFPKFEQFKTTVAKLEEPVATDPAIALTPDEDMRRARDRIEEALAEDILGSILDASPAFFERLVVRLVVAMGYGGSLAEAGRALGQAGDGGVDGVIDEDTLGLDRIYVQAKRYKPGNSVGSNAIRDFFGALDGHKAGKGLFVTTSTFTAAATETAKGLSKRIVLVDGARLTRLMIRFEVGCRVEEQMAIKRIDEDFFEA